MPWHVATSDSCPPSKPYAVIKDATGEVEGCHETRQKAEAQMAALYASETKAWSSSYITALPDSAFACVDSSGRHYPHHDASGKLDLPHLRNALSRLGQSDTTSCGAAHLRAHARAQGVGKSEDDLRARPIITAQTLKAEQLGTARWRVLAIPFGGPFKGGKDGDGEYFSPRTDIKAEWFRERPVLWHHGMDAAKDDPTDALGIEDELEKKRDGWWADMWLERSNHYWERVNGLLAAGKVYGSSGALGHIVRKAADGEILVWPHIEQTLTPTPANPFARIVPVKALTDFTSAGIAVDEATRPLFAEPDSEPDLELDLPVEGGEAPATKLAAALDQYAEAIKERFGR